MDFNPRPREEGDLCLCVICVIVLYFNPRPREEGDYRQQAVYQLMCDFNPRPREEGDDFETTVYDGQTISIHALVKRATRNAGD